MRNRASREQAIAILEELSFNATYWDSENNGPEPKITDEIWNTALLIEQLYQRMESRKQLPYFTDPFTDLPREKQSSTGEILKEILKQSSVVTFKKFIHQLHGFLNVFYETVYEFERGSFDPNQRFFTVHLNRLYHRLYNRTLQKDSCQDDLSHVKEDLAFGKKFRQEQTQLISRTGRTCNSAIEYFDQLLQQNGKLIVVSLSLCRDYTKTVFTTDRMQYEALINEWKRFLQNGRNSHPMTWSLGFLAGIRATSEKGLYIQAYFFFDTEQADPRDLQHAVGNYWVRTTNGCYHATPITCLKKFKYKSVYEISLKDQVGINLMHNRIIPSLTKARLFVTPLPLLNEKKAPNSKPNQSKSETVDVFLRGERPATRPKGRRKEGQSELPDDQVSS